MDFRNLRQHRNQWYRTTLLCLISFCTSNSIGPSIHAQNTISVDKDRHFMKDIAEGWCGSEHFLASA